MAGVQEKQLRWYNIALMSFITVWGFGNVVNNYANQGLVVVSSWIFIFALYFIPYALIVGQLGSTFKEGKGGVSTWIKHTMGPGLAYLAAWTYWVVHIPYLAQKPQAILIALGWALKGDGSLIKEYTVVALQGLTLALFVFFMWVASRGMKSLKIVGSVAGIAMFVMSILYVVMAVTAPAITDVQIATTNITWESFIPHIDLPTLPRSPCWSLPWAARRKFRHTLIRHVIQAKNFRKGCSFWLLWWRYVRFSGRWLWE